VKVINAGASGHYGTAKITKGETTIGSDLKASDGPDAVEVPIYPLDRVLEAHGPFDVMKMGCESCGYDAIASNKWIGELKYHSGNFRCPGPRSPFQHALDARNLESLHGCFSVPGEDIVQN